MSFPIEDYDSYSGVADISLASYSGLRHNTSTWDRFFGHAGGAGGVSSNTDVASSSLDTIIINTLDRINFEPSVDAEKARLLVEFNCQGGNADLFILSPPANYLVSLTIELINRTLRDIGAVIVHYGSRPYQISYLFFPGDVINLSIDPDTQTYNLVGSRSFLEFSPIFELGQDITSGNEFSDMHTLNGILTVRPAPMEEQDFGVEIRPDATTELGDFIARMQIHNSGILTISVRCLFNKTAGWPTAYEPNVVVGGACYVKESETDVAYGTFVQSVFEGNSTSMVRFYFTGRDENGTLQPTYYEFEPVEGWASFKWVVYLVDKTVSSFYNDKIIARYKLLEMNPNATTIDRVVVQSFNNSWVFFKDLRVEHQPGTFSAVT